MKLYDLKCQYLYSKIDAPALKLRRHHTEQTLNSLRIYQRRAEDKSVQNQSKTWVLEFFFHISNISISK